MGVPLSTIRKWKKEWLSLYKDNIVSMEWEEYYRYKQLEADNVALRERVAELEAQLANYHTHLTQGTLVWKVPPPDYYLQQFDGEGVA